MPQRLLIDIDATGLEPEDIELLQHPEVAGLILFARNYESRAQLAELSARVRSIRPELLLAVDQEGGRVQRFRGAGFTTLPSLQKMGDFCVQQPQCADDTCRSLAWLMAVEVMAAGLDISFAPVLDLDRDRCKAIGDRAFSADPEIATELARAYLAGMAEAGMAATAKHFPGHGSVTQDSHLALPEDSRCLEEIEAHDMQPFIRLLGAYQAVMPGHLLFPQVDAQPVGFSSVWLQSILRRQLGFEGVIFSDDLSMAGAAASGSYARRAEIALAAGCDLLLACNNRAGACEILEYLEGNDSGSGAHAVNGMRAGRVWTLEQVRQDARYTRAQEYLRLIEGSN